MAFVSECLQPIVVVVGDDDSAVGGDAYSSRRLELAWLIALRAEHEQERAIDRRPYLHSMITGIGDDDSMSIIIDRNPCWIGEIFRFRLILVKFRLPLGVRADLEQEREIDRRPEHQSVVFGIGDDDAMIMLVDRNASRTAEELRVS